MGHPSCRTVQWATKLWEKSNFSGQSTEKKSPCKPENIWGIITFFSLSLFFLSQFYYKASPSVGAAPLCGKWGWGERMECRSICNSKKRNLSVVRTPKQTGLALVVQKGKGNLCYFFSFFSLTTLSWSEKPVFLRKRRRKMGPKKPESMGEILRRRVGEGNP